LFSAEMGFVGCDLRKKTDPQNTGLSFHTPALLAQTPGACH
jgi:hypothetical protein